MKASKRIVLVVAAFVSNSSFAAPDPKIDQAALRSAMEGTLKDSESARYRNFKFATKDGELWYICGEVNAKNSFGGYVGFETFSVMAVQGDKKKPIKTFIGPSIGQVAEMVCAEQGIPPY